MPMLPNVIARPPPMLLRSVAEMEVGESSCTITPDSTHSREGKSRRDGEVDLDGVPA